MNAAELKTMIEQARERLVAAETEMERVLHHVDNAPRADKSIISASLSTAFAQLKAAKNQLLDLEQAIVKGD